MPEPEERNWRRILRPEYTVIFFACKDRKCGQQWEAAAEFYVGAPRDNEVPHVIEKKDASCPGCGYAGNNIAKAWGVYGCTVTNPVLPGEPLIGPKTPG